MDDNTSASRLPTIAPLLPGIPGLSWTEIRAAAVELAGHGWPVLPGTYQLVEHGSWLGKAGAGGLEPAAALWQQAATTNPRRGVGLVDAAAVLGPAGMRYRSKRRGGAGHSRPARPATTLAV